MMRKLTNLLLYSKWTDCKHPIWKRTRGYHTQCTGCGAERGRQIND